MTDTRARRRGGPSPDGGSPGADALSARYPVWLCDVWGVVHNGVKAFAPALECLARHRAQGGAVVLITNAPRPAAAILPQLRRLKVPADCYDHIVSSGDVTRALLARWEGGRAHHIGPERDLGLLEGIAIDWVGIEEAEAVVCSGLLDDETESPEDYDGVLALMAGRGLEMICANPDKVVQKGSRLLPCAGALAERYEALGGKVRMAGKPFAPIYREAMRRAGESLGRTVGGDEVLAIGDGLATDAEGARRNDLALLFIADGIHGRQLAAADGESVAVAVREAVPGVRLAGVMRALAWPAPARAQAV
jgi:HAD superfamily hydrolase (TIGR01459 family)